MSDWFLENMRLWFENNPHIDEDLKKDAVFYGEVPAFPIMKGKDHPMYGKKHSAEAKAKMRARKLGIKTGPPSEEHKNKLRKKRPHAGKNIANGKAQEWIVTNTRTGEEFLVKNLNAFCRENGLAPGNLYKTVKGTCHHHKGYSIRHVNISRL